MRDRAYAIRSHITIAPLTRTIRQIPSHVLAGPADGLPTVSAINLDDLQTIPIADLERRITTLSFEKMAEVDRAIKFALALT